MHSIVATTFCLQCLRAAHALCSDHLCQKCWPLCSHLMGVITPRLRMLDCPLFEKISAHMSAKSPNNQGWTIPALLYCNTILDGQYCIGIVVFEKLRNTEYWAILAIIVHYWPVPTTNKYKLLKNMYLTEKCTRNYVSYSKCFYTRLEV
jgi:hypothetical protein